MLFQNLTQNDRSLSSNIQYVQPILLGLFIGAVFFDRSISIGALGAYIIFWSFSSSFKHKWDLLKSRRYLLLLPLLFIFYALSLMYSQHPGISYLEKELLLLIVPAIVGSILLSSREINIIFRIFILSCFAFTLLSIIKAYIFYNLPTEHFTISHLPHQLSADLHAPYLSLLIVLGNLLILLINEGKKRFPVWDIILCFYFSAFVLLLSSRTALFCNLLLFSGYLYFRLVRKNKIGLYVLILMSLLVVIALTYIYFPHFQSRITDFSRVGNGISERVTVFQASSIILMKNPIIGVGIGDIEPELVKIYSGWNLPEYFFGLNPHNQFLFTGLAIGIPGILFLLFLLFYPVYLAVKVSQPLFVAFYLIMFFAFLTEVVLARYWGVAAFSFFYTVLTASLLDIYRTKPSHLTNQL